LYLGSVVVKFKLIVSPPNLFFHACSGAAIIIALSQVKYILGLTLPRTDKVYEQLDAIFSNLDQFNWAEFCKLMFLLILILRGMLPSTIGVDQIYLETESSQTTNHRLL
jgi:MFS superfamily sulfate permease-like transporter